MKLYATTTSERASKGQGGNEYLDVSFSLTGKNVLNLKAEVRNNKETGEITFKLIDYHFGNIRTVYYDRFFVVVEPKGEKEKGKQTELIEQGTCKKCGNYFLQCPCQQFGE